MVRHFRWYAAKTSRWYAHACPPKGTAKSNKLRMHNLVMGMLGVDHRGDSLDNRKANLRVCTDAQNQQNTGPRRGSSRFKGVSWYTRKGKWRVAFNWNGKTHFVGYFSDEVEAALGVQRGDRPSGGRFREAEPTLTLPEMKVWQCQTCHRNRAKSR